MKNTEKDHDKNIYERGLGILIAALMSIACGTNPPPPEDSAIFINPAPETNFGADLGDVILSQLNNVTVCYNVNEVDVPDVSGESCVIGNTYQGAINLSCDAGETDTSHARNVQISFVWPGLTENDPATTEQRSATFYLDCTVETPPDADNDGVPDSSDNCINVFNDQQEDADNDGIGDACETDTDNDTVIDDNDNCPTDPNPLQEDDDNDNIGNACDTDADNDTVDDVSDNCPLVYNPLQEDADNDGTGDACEPPGMSANETMLWAWLDYEDTSQKIAKCINNGCNNPGGSIDWTINNSHSYDVDGDSAQESLSSGEMQWKVVVKIFQFGADSNFWHRDAEYKGNTFNAHQYGFYTLSGGTQTMPDGAGSMTGTHNGYVLSTVQIAGEDPSSGQYDIYCTDPGCEATAVRYVFNVVGGEYVFDTPVILPTTLP